MAHCVLYVAFMTSFATAGFIEKELVTASLGSFKLTTEVGISPQGRDHYIFEIQGCEGAIIALCDIVTIKNDRGRYYMVVFGWRKNTVTIIRDSCFTCRPSALVNKPVLDCNEYKSFWIWWDNKGAVKLGEGRKLFENQLLNYTASNHFPVMFSQVASIKPPANWKFFMEENVVFSSPLPDGSSTVTVKEDVAIGSVIYQMVVQSDVEIKLLTTGTPFKIIGKEIQTTGKLDYEAQQFYLLRFRTKDPEVNISLTVLIEDINDETPEIVLRGGIHIPEELPVGFIIGGVFTAKDRDNNDTLSFRLEGEDSSYFSVLDTGQLRIEKRIDRDGPGGKTMLKKLTLHVEDGARHHTAYSLSIVITDINDNAPTCSSGLFTKTVKLTAGNDKPIMNIPCTDGDSGHNAQFSLRIVPMDEQGRLNKNFWLVDFDLYANMIEIRKEIRKREKSTYILRLLAVDSPKMGVANTGTALVIINIPPRQPRRVNDFRPVWVGTVPNDDGNFPPVAVPEDFIPGSVIKTFRVEDKDPGTSVAFMLASVIDDQGRNNTGPFSIGVKSGRLGTTSSLDYDRDTGGVKFYTILLMATDGEHVISGYINVSLTNANDNEPRFNTTLFSYSVLTFKNPALPLVTFSVSDQDDDSIVNLRLEDDSNRYLRLVKEQHGWDLKFWHNVDFSDDIPRAVVVTAYDNGAPSLSSQAVVLITDLPCKMQETTSTPRTPWSKSTDDLSRVPSVKGTRSNAHDGDARVTSQGVQIGVEDYDEGSSGEGGVSNRPPKTRHKDQEVCKTPGAVEQELSRTGLYLKVACAVEGLIIVMAFLLILAKRCGCLKKSSPNTEQPERKEPLGCETALRSHDNARSSSVRKKVEKTHSKQGCSPSVTPTPSRLDTELQGSSHDTRNKRCTTAESSSSSELMLQDEMTMVAKNRFLGLRRKLAPPSPVQLYSDHSGFSLYDKDLVNVARSKFLELIKETETKNEPDCPELVYMAKGKFLHLLNNSESERPSSVLDQVETRASDIVAVAKDKFIGLLGGSADPTVALAKETPPLDLLTLLDGRCFRTSDEAMVTVFKEVFLELVRDFNSMDNHMTSNDAIMAYTAGFNPSTNTVFVSKYRYLELLKTIDFLVMSKTKVLKLIEKDCDPWGDSMEKFMKSTSGIEEDTGETYLTREQFDLLSSKVNASTSEFNSMIAVSKLRLGEMLLKRSMDPKCNETLNYYVEAVCPSTEVAYISKSKFGDLIDDEDDTIEISQERFELFLQSRNINMDETDFSSMSLGTDAKSHTLYMAKTRFLNLLSGSNQSKDSANGDDMLEVSRNVFDQMVTRAGETDVPIIAVDQENDTVFIDKEMFIKLSSDDFEETEMLVLSKEKAQQIVGTDNESKNDFWRENALASVPASGKIYIAKSKFLSLKTKSTKHEHHIAEGGDEDEDEGLVSVPRDQLNNMLDKDGGNRSNSFVRAHAEGVNPTTGAVFIARRKFLKLASQKTPSGDKTKDEIVSVSRETLEQMASESGNDNKLAECAMAFSDDKKMVYLAKRKLLALSKRTDSGLSSSQNELQDDGLVAMTGDALAEMVGEQSDVSKSDLINKYATAFNPHKGIAYVAKDRFLNLAKIASKRTSSEDTGELIAVPQGNLLSLIGSNDREMSSSGLLQHGVAFNASTKTAFMAKDRFMKLVEKGGPGQQGESSPDSDLVSVTQENLIEIMGSDNASHEETEEKIKQIAVAINPVSKTVYMAKSRFIDVAKQSRKTSGSSDENDIVAVSNDQVTEILNQNTEHPCPEAVLSKYAMAFNKPSGKIYFTRKKFRELIRKSTPESKHKNIEAATCETIVSEPGERDKDVTGVDREMSEAKCSDENLESHTTDAIAAECEPEEVVVEDPSTRDGVIVPVNTPVNEDVKSYTGHVSTDDTRSHSSDAAFFDNPSNLAVAGVSVEYRTGPDTEDSEYSDADYSDSTPQPYHDRRSRCVLTVTDELDNDLETHTSRNKLKTPQTGLFGRLPTSEKKKKKIKQWDPEVRNRLYGTAKEKNARDKPKKGKNKIGPETDAAELSELRGTSRARSSKSKYSGVEPDNMTSETDETIYNRSRMSFTESKKAAKKTSKRKKDRRN